MSTEEGKKDPQNWREATAALWEVVQEALQRLEGVPTQEAFEALQAQVRQVEEHLAIEGDYFRGAIGGMEGRLQSAIKEGDEFAVLFETLQSDVNLLSENFVQIRSEFALLQEAALEWQQGARETQGQVSVAVNEVECIRSDINRVGNKTRVRLDAQKMLVQDLQKRMDDRDEAGRQFRECLDALQEQVDQTQRDGAEGRADFDTLQAEVRKFAIETVDQKHVNADTIDVMKTEIKSLQAFRERIDENMSDYIETATAAYVELSERVRAAIIDGSQWQAQCDSKFDRLFTLTEDLNAWQNTILRRLEALEACWPLPDDDRTDTEVGGQGETATTPQKPKEEGHNFDGSFTDAQEAEHLRQELQSTYGVIQGQQARIASLEAALKTAIEEKERAEQDAGKWCVMEKQHAELQALAQSMAEDEPSGGLAYTPDLDEFGRDMNDTDYPADAALGALVRRMPELLTGHRTKVTLCCMTGPPEHHWWGVGDRDAYDDAAKALRAALGDNTETPDRDGGVTRPEELGLSMVAWMKAKKAMEEDKP